MQNLFNSIYIRVSDNFGFSSLWVENNVSVTITRGEEETSFSNDMESFVTAMLAWQVQKLYVGLT